MATHWWPLFDLVITTPRLVLRPVREGDAPGLIAAVDAGIHDPAEMPFGMAWTDVDPPKRATNGFQHWSRCWADWSPEKWRLPLLIELDGRAIGSQGVHADEFATFRTVETGSWLTRDAQGNGFGTEMRAAVLHFAFEGLGAHVARSEAFADNAASNSVSRKLGYEPDGTNRLAPRGEPRWTQRYKLTRERWNEIRPDIDITITGLDGCREMFGA
jgi:RimJ/RimL family protein N-acetyltransferase